MRIVACTKLVELVEICSELKPPQNWCFQLLFIICHLLNYYYYFIVVKFETVPPYYTTYSPYSVNFKIIIIHNITVQSAYICVNYECTALTAANIPHTEHQTHYFGLDFNIEWMLSDMHEKRKIHTSCCYSSTEWEMRK